jgi:methylated-DNA-protein-cysteine methyltransferase related protein
VSPRKKDRAAVPDGPFAQVHSLIERIPRGRVATYGQISALVDGRITALAVGWALRSPTRPLPWHRVVNSRGGMSTEDANPGLQRARLEAEGIRFRRDGTIDLERYQWRPRP